MSYSTLYEVHRTKVTSIREYSNGHGSAPPVWDYLWQTHVGPKLTPRELASLYTPPDEPDYPVRKFPMMASDQSITSKLWALADDESVPKDHRAILLLTCDRWYVGTADTTEFAAALDRMHAAILAETKWTWTHLAAIAADLRTHKPRRRPMGYGVSCTSVCDSWEGYPAQPATDIYVSLS